ncbi:hypothetical protein Q31b_45670 [Novipirellula aureliae]|uniref:VTT domain-containing protein n=1 Tax=Novipirellula aureliae TaxID=2527966 RepID=A0A5C6DLV1_9BACT|nr:DedA family protein [Novipirellula aureliae]TWU37778.1 hypothetical protein Q31b_45670 [Novipirellula aureliae]
MSFSPAELNEHVLTWIVAYGPPFLGATLFLCAVGVPLPGTIFVIAGGAFMRQGVMDVTWTPIEAFAGAVLGDLTSYGMGRSMRVRIQRRFSDSPKWKRAESTFQKRGGVAIYLTRWLLTPLAVPTNLLAGSGGYSLKRFIAFDIAGELTWLLVFGGLGYGFGSQWEAISDLSRDFTGLFVGIAICIAGVYLLARMRK